MPQLVANTQCYNSGTLVAAAALFGRLCGTTPQCDRPHSKCARVRAALTKMAPLRTKRKHGAGQPWSREPLWEEVGRRSRWATLFDTLGVDIDPPMIDPADQL